MKNLNLGDLIQHAYEFSNIISSENHPALRGVTDGKAVGTYVEHRFKDYLSQFCMFENGNSARGVDLPSVNTDIKVTSLVQPQSSCPFKTARQKIYGLGYNLLVFVYEKYDDVSESRLNIVNMTFVDESRTSDYSITRLILQTLAIGGTKEDIIGILIDRNVPGDEIVYEELAEEILSFPPEQGYLTISNALQWRLQYARVIGLDNSVDGIINYNWKEGEKINEIDY